MDFINQFILVNGNLFNKFLMNFTNRLLKRIILPPLLLFTTPCIFNRTLLDGKAALRQSAIGVSLPTLPPPPHQTQTRSLLKATTYCRKIARNVASMATGEAPAEVAAFETPEIVKTVQEYWDKLEDKYAVISLVAAAGVGLVASTGVIAAIDKLPLVPGVLELVGIGYNGYFAYKNLIFKPERMR